jgi:hypothetical protein
MLNNGNAEGAGFTGSVGALAMISCQSSMGGMVCIWTEVGVVNPILMTASMVFGCRFIDANVFLWSFHFLVHLNYHTSS